MLQHLSCYWNDCKVCFILCWCLPVVVRTTKSAVKTGNKFDLCVHTVWLSSMQPSAVRISHDKSKELRHLFHTFQYLPKKKPSSNRIHCASWMISVATAFICTFTRAILIPFLPRWHRWKLWRICASRFHVFSSLVTTNVWISSMHHVLQIFSCRKKMRSSMHYFIIFADLQIESD